MVHLRLAHRLGTASLLAVVLTALPGAALAKRGATDPGAEPGVCPKILDARAPPGGVLQLTVALTEPTPVITARAQFLFPVGSVMGVALFSPAGALSDAAGVAVVGDGSATLQIAAPSGDFGTNLDGPILTLALDVPADTPIGTTGPLTLDPSTSLFVDPTGQPYSQQLKQGTFTIADGVNIRNVSPGGGSLPAGATVTIDGLGFQPGALVEIDGVLVASTTYVSDTQVQATLAEPADLYGRGVTVRNPDKTRARYYAYLRAAWLDRSARPLLAATDPVFSPRALSTAVYGDVPGDGQFLAVALQNAAAADANVTVELQSAASEVLASASVPLPAGTKVARELTELVPGAALAPGGALVVRSDVPVQVLGMIGDDAAGSVRPLLPAVALP